MKTPIEILQEAYWDIRARQRAEHDEETNIRRACALSDITDAIAILTAAASEVDRTPEEAATVAELLEKIHAAAAARGCILNRAQMDFGNNRNILYSVHPDGPTALLTTREGTGRNCEAFRELSKLLAELS